jgi:hypothetical protein
MNTSERVLRYDLTATDGSDRLSVQYALPGRDFETAEALETDGLTRSLFARSAEDCFRQSRDVRAAKTWLRARHG